MHKTALMGRFQAPYAISPHLVPSRFMNSPTPRLLVSVATYNERENLPSLVEEIWRYAPEAHIFVVDDNSPDGTGDWAKGHASKDPRLSCLVREGKLGLGTATVAAMKFAIANEFDYVLNLDADFSHHPKYIPALLAGMRDRDVMIGSRYVRGGRIDNWSFLRRFMSGSVNFYARWLLGLRTHDCSGAFRCYRVSLLKQIDLGAIRSRGYSFQEEILWRLKNAGARMGEVPIVFRDRQRGVSKISTVEAWNAIWTILRFGVKNWVGV